MSDRDQQQQQQDDDATSKPSAAAAVLDPNAEFDVEELAPSMRSVSVLQAPSSAAAATALPTHYDRHQGAYLFRDGAGGRGGGDSLVVPTRPKEAFVAPAPVTTTSTTGDVGVSGSTSSSSLVTPALPFETALFPLERCHYYTNKPAVDLHSDIEAALLEKGVVFNFAPDKFKFTCEYLTGMNMVRFVCRAYFVPEDGRIVVEFQRRAGCCIVCAKVVEAIRSTLLARECNSEAAPVAIKTFSAKPLDIAVCQMHEEKGEELKGAAAGGGMSLQERQQVQQCKLMDDLRACLAEGKDGVLTEFAKVLIPLSQLGPAHLLGDPSYAELLAALGVHVAVPNARLGALACIANLAATCFPSSQTTKDAGDLSTPLLQRETSSDAEEDHKATSEDDPRPTLGEVHAWFEGVLGTVVAALTSSEENAHVRREAARALLHLTRESFARTEIVRTALQQCSKDADAAKDRLLQSYLQGALANVSGEKNTSS